MTSIPAALADHVFNADIEDGDAVVDAYVIVRVQNIETGDTSVVVSTTAHTDVVVATGLLACATEISAQTDWARHEDD